MKNRHLTTVSSGRSADRGTIYCRRHGGRVVLLLSIFALSAGDLMAQGTSVKGGVNLDHFGGAKVDQLVKG